MMHFFLLAGGLGTRARPLSQAKPKPLFPLHGTPLLSLMLEQLCQKGVNTGAINVHHLSHQVEAHIPSSMGIKILREQQLSGNKILKAAPPSEDTPLLVVNGDVFADIPVWEMAKKMSSTDCDAVLLTRKSDRKDCPALDISGDRFLRRKPWQKDQDRMYTGIALLKRQVIDRIDELNMFDSLAKNSFDVRVVLYGGIWLDIGTPAHYFLANRRYCDYFKISDRNSFSPGVKISTEADVSDSIIWENTKIEGKISIQRCIVLNDLNLNGGEYREKIIGASQVWDLGFI